MSKVEKYNYYMPAGWKIVIWGKKNERKTREFRYSMTITNSPLIA